MPLYRSTVHQFHGKVVIGQWNDSSVYWWRNPALHSLPFQLEAQKTGFKLIQVSSIKWRNAWLCETPVPNLNEAWLGHWLLFPLWVFSGCALKPIKWLMNELEFGTVAMVSDSTFSSLPDRRYYYWSHVNAAASPQRIGIPWVCIARLCVFTQRTFQPLFSREKGWESDLDRCQRDIEWGYSFSRCTVRASVLCFDYSLFISHLSAHLHRDR